MFFAAVGIFFTLSIGMDIYEALESSVYYNVRSKNEYTNADWQYWMHIVIKLGLLLFILIGFVFYIIKELRSKNDN